MACSNTKIRRLERDAPNFRISRKINILPVLVCALAICAAGISTQTLAADRLLDGQAVRLRGILTTEKHYGPPGYGENKKQDILWKILVLRLDRAVDLFDPKEPTHRTSGPPIKDVQVTFWATSAYDAEADRAAENGLHVEIEGDIASEGIHQFLDASLNATKLTILSK